MIGRARNWSARRKARAASLVAAAVLLVALASVIALPGSTSQSDPAASAASTVPVAAAATVGREHAAPARAADVRVEAPAIGLRTGVLVDLGLRGSGEPDVPRDPAIAGRYVNGPRPGEPGPAVVAARVSGDEGVFARLDELRPGEVVTAWTARGTRTEFVVDEVERYGHGDFPARRVHGDTEGPQLRLIACADAEDRRGGGVIVYARER
ncbi:MAG TPA: class F sortase [Promicromonospora sp.]|nr:class F sortase [Promicromonospora sp.]